MPVSVPVPVQFPVPLPGRCRFQNQSLSQCRCRFRRQQRAARGGAERGRGAGSPGAVPRGPYLRRRRAATAAGAAASPAGRGAGPAAARRGFRGPARGVPQQEQRGAAAGASGARAVRRGAAGAAQPGAAAVVPAIAGADALRAADEDDVLRAVRGRGGPGGHQAAAPAEPGLRRGRRAGLQRGGGPGRRPVRFSEVLEKWRRFFHQMAAEEGQAGRAVLDTKLEVEKLQEALANLGIASKAESQQWFTGENLGTSGTVDLLDWNSLFDSRTKLSRPLLIPNRKTGQLEPLLSRFSEEEELQMKRVLQRMDVLAKRAMEKGVRLMVDAEQSYFQPAISRLTVETQRRFNGSQPIIYNTYQCYLKEAYNNVTRDLELSRREGWHFGTKLVRGAYMEQERERAAQMGYEDPINPTYEKTNEMYHRCLDYVLEEIKHSRKASVMVASHNEDTVKFALRRMMELGIHPSDKKVCFGQLLGMCDQITFPLGQAGFPVYKYVPYGPVNEVLPYLSRRAQENRGFMQRAKRERDLLWKEVKRRLLTGNLFGH
ncbi:proline dehydrogenase 1, mitochondrial-like isoform X1 [Passer montanus]|uniref:proline dehydrogenase 1, mitochondrial-like isoform X1 n=1 Tax=Passer montanus TaxID=9160 RepID=UPI001960B192|nr:proline dehydrogenase 1, mitochondrial-like isoform X1 [Passer montanus]